MKRNRMHQTWVTEDPVLDEEKQNTSLLGYRGSRAGWREIECITPGWQRILCWMKRNRIHHSWVTEDPVLNEEKQNASHLGYRRSSAGWRETEFMQHLGNRVSSAEWRETECITPRLPRIQCWMKRNRMHQTWVTEDPVLAEEKQNASHLGYRGSRAGWRETECITPGLPRILCWMKRNRIHHSWVTEDPVLNEEKQNASHLVYQGSSAGWRETECISLRFPRIQCWMKRNRMHQTWVTQDPVLDEEKQNTSLLGYRGSSAGWRETEWITPGLPGIQCWMKRNRMHHTWVTEDPVLDEEKQNTSLLGYRGSSAEWRETECITPGLPRIQCWLKRNWIYASHLRCQVWCSVASYKLFTCCQAE